MDQLTKDYFYLIFFRLEIYKRTGEEFQIFFSDLMKYIDRDFIKVTAFGGDGGNDGCNATLNHYYQIYSPKPTTTHHDSCVTVLSKTQTDFEKLKENWPAIKTFIFVFNDRFQGIPTKLLPLLQSIKVNNALEESFCISSDKMQNHFQSLEEKQKLTLLDRFPINEAPFEIDPTALGQLLHHLSNESSFTLGLLSIDLPAWDEKIKFNGIGETLNSRMKMHSHQSFRVVNYLKILGSSNAQEVAESVKKAYNESKSEFHNSIDNAADLRYFWLVDRLIPSKVLNGPNIILNQYRMAAEILISTYFESCDAYDNPRDLNS